MLLDMKFFGDGEEGFWENTGKPKNRSLERKKFPVISSLEGRSATLLGAPLKKSFREFFGKAL